MVALVACSPVRDQSSNWMQIVQICFQVATRKKKGASVGTSPGVSHRQWLVCATTARNVFFWKRVFPHFRIAKKKIQIKKFSPRAALQFTHSLASLSHEQQSQMNAFACNQSCNALALTPTTAARTVFAGPWPKKNCRLWRVAMNAYTSSIQITILFMRNY